jgi:putative Holliday junction resolvase
LNKRKRIIALDVGKKRTGLAQSDPLMSIASPIGAFNNQDIFVKVKEIEENDEILKIVVGWPITLKGHQGESVEMVQKFLKELNNKFPNIPVVTLDERFTSSLAQQAMIDSGMKKKNRQQKGTVDAFAASILLQNFLDSQKFR